MPIQVVERLTVTPSGQMQQEIEQVNYAVFASERHRIVVEPSDISTVERLRRSPTATPQEVIIGTLPDSRLRLKQPIRADVIREGRRVGVWSPEFEELGTGPHLSAAIRDFQQSLVELYFALQEEQAHLGSDLANLWQRMQDAIAFQS